MAARIELELPDDAVLVDPEHAKEEWLNEAVIVVQLITTRSWAQIPPGAKLFSLFSFYRHLRGLNCHSQRWNTTGFPLKIFNCAA